VGSLIEPQNKGRWFGLKTNEMVFSDLTSKLVATVFSSLTSKPVAIVFSGLVSKPVATVSFGLASKPVVEGFSVWTSKPVASRDRVSQSDIKTDRDVTVDGACGTIIEVASSSS
jgi:hypothetical protein